MVKISTSLYWNRPFQVGKGEKKVNLDLGFKIRDLVSRSQLQYFWLELKPTYHRWEIITNKYWMTILYNFDLIYNKL